MTEEFLITVLPGDAWDEADREAAVELILDCKAVSNEAALRTNFQSATHLAMIRQQGRLIATATIKRPQLSYRKRVSNNSGIDVRTVDAEFGYVAVLMQFREHHLGTALADQLLNSFHAPIFATTSHPAMRKILQREGFHERGESWIGGSPDEPSMLSLLLRGVSVSRKQA